jgi:outer membrane receptor protein involved in Fe transport
VNQKKLQEKSPNNISELMPELPGTDIVGAGTNQGRPVIRGLRGQRILLLTDGIRLSNSRRTQSFGELPALVDVSGLERVEVVRGPASVLYGSEAIGGVVNMITRAPIYNRAGTNIAGNLGYRFSSADKQHKGFVNLNGNVGNFGFMLSGSYRKAENYMAPAGSFGNITLSEDTPVNDTGVKDNSLNLYLGYRVSQHHDLSFRFETYSAQDAGFGYVNPAVYAPGDTKIQLLYPEQKMQKYTLKYENRGLNFIMADGLSLVGYYLKNKRTFDTNIEMSLFPGAGMNIQSSNFTDVNTIGSRLEFTKVLFNSHILTYGVELFRDSSENTDTNTTTMFGFGLPLQQVDTSTRVPNANLLSAGAFIQDDISLFKRSSLILGLRYQYVHARTKETPGIEGPLVDSKDSTFVGSASFIYGVTDDLKLVLSLGRGFRSPNLPERFFQGVTPDGSGFQLQNTELEPETSFNVDVGFKYRLKNFYVESSYFRNMIYDGIQIAPTGEMLGHLVKYKNVNVDKLKLQGVEVLGNFDFDFGLSLTGSYSYITSENLTNPELLNADTYGSRVNFNVRYSFPNDLFWVEYHVRHNGDRKDVDLGNNPIGAVIPGFTVHSLRTGVTFFKKSGFPQQFGLVIGNLTNILYSEFSNASFFRPAPKRHIVLTWNARF